ncbi:MAG: sensor histidine kinase [Glaciecola sp.]|nr:sensor histidine kinase [Glaciecola sp.]MDG1816412.1 sensor histidine kinase [Glaciecola sp.]MDG2098473.1 sensor histidine kinase [Glaciecola sp.]
MSIRALINLRIIASLILILVFSGIVAIWQARNSVEKEVRSSINLAVQMIEFGLNQDSLDSNDIALWIDNINNMQPVRHLDVHVGKNEKTEKNSTLSNANEQEQSAPQWFVKAVMVDFLTHNHNITIADGSIKPIVINANPMDEINEAWGETKIFFWTIVFMSAIIFLTINFVFNSMLRAVNTILYVLRQVEGGYFDQVLPPFKISEFNAIAVEINGMSNALNTARKNNQALALRTMQIQETERKDMSRELHDEMGQSLTAIKAMAVTCQQPSSDVSAITSSIINICDHLSVVVHSMMKTLHPLSLSELGLGASLSELVREWQRCSESLHFDLNYDASLESLNSDIAIHVYRIVQECLTNVVKHANASKVNIVVIKLNNEVKISISDNGQGKQSNSPGFGLLGMRERAENLGGTFSLETPENSGVNVVVQLPFRGNK